MKCTPPHARLSRAFPTASLVSAALVSALASAPSAQLAPTEHRLDLDGWSELVTIRTPDGRYVAPVHATLLPSGEIVFVGYAKTTEGPGGEQTKYAWKIAPTPHGEPVPSELIVDELAVPYDADPLLVEGPALVQDDLFCAGHTLDAEGRLFTVGGTRGVLELLTGEVFAIGLPYATRFDGTTWERVLEDSVAVGPLGFPSRWYGTATRLPDGRILAMAGDDMVWPKAAANLTAEIFDPASGSWSVASEYGQMPFDVWNPDYAHPFVLPTPIGPWELVAMGGTSKPVLLALDDATDAATWDVHPNPRPNAASFLPNHGASSVMLPLRVDDGEWGYSNGTVMVAGGTHGAPVQRQADLFDPVAGGWTASLHMPVPRHHPSTVLLPDGRILVVAGHAMPAQTGLRHATLIDPAHGFDSKLGAADGGEIRGYHSVSLLLPDGRVLVGGGQGTVTGAEPAAEKPNFRYYLPSYLSKPRPVIAAAPDVLPDGGWFSVTTLGVKPSEVVLVGLGSMTHSFDANQRMIQLEASAPMPITAGHTMLVKAPANDRIAPPGAYMLFVLSENRAPSVARIVRVQ